MQPAPIMAAHLQQGSMREQSELEFGSGLASTQNHAAGQEAERCHQQSRSEAHMRWMRSLAMATSTSSRMVRAIPAGENRRHMAVATHVPRSVGMHMGASQTAAWQPRPSSRSEPHSGRCQPQSRRLQLALTVLCGSQPAQIRCLNLEHNLMVQGGRREAGDPSNRGVGRPSWLRQRASKPSGHASQPASRQMHASPAAAAAQSAPACLGEHG